MIFAGPALGMPTAIALGAPRSNAVRALQNDLRKLGVPVRASGVLDQATVDALNGIFEGSVDVPRALASGQLTAFQVARQIGLVHKALKIVARGAMNVEAG